MSQISKPTWNSVILGIDTSLQMVYCVPAGGLFHGISGIRCLCLHDTHGGVTTGTEFTVCTQLSWLELSLGMAAPG